MRMRTEIRSKKDLAVKLSRIKAFSRAEVTLEQYPTDPEIAAEVLWNAHMDGKVIGRVAADLGCGTGILGIGMLMLGAKKVYFVDVDEEAISVAERYYSEMESEGKAEFFCGDISDFSADDVDLVVQNPPFGTKEKHADRFFLEKAFSLSDTVYSFHKSETLNFLEAISDDNGFAIIRQYQFKFPLKKTMSHHEKPVKYVDVVCCLFEKVKG